MSFAISLIYANLILCGVNVLCESTDNFDFMIWKVGAPEDWEDLYNNDEYSFEEGVEYEVWCERGGYVWDLHWEVEPYGLKSSTAGGKYYSNIYFTLHRDDQLTLRCSANNTREVQVKATTFIWDRNPVSSTPPPPPTTVSTDDNECNGPCFCTNTNGSSTCECQQGYNKNATGWCKDINECQLNISDCKDSERCWNTEGSFKCCANDTILDKNGNCVCPENHIYITSNPHEECDAHPRTRTCYTRNNTEHCAALQRRDGGCNCVFYLQLYTSKKSSIDNNECKGPCYCPNTNGSSTCECLQGYNKNATGWCEDINECQLNISDCKNSERCWNTEGSFKCCASDTILDNHGNCVCPEHHIYYQNQGCVYNQCLNTSCGLGAQCTMELAKSFCFCPYGTAGNPHEECGLLAEPGPSPYIDSLEPSIEISIYVEKADKSLRHFTTSADELILGKEFSISVSARDVNFTKPEKRLICHELDKPTKIHVNQSLESAAAADCKYIAKVPQAVSSMNGTWVCLITGSTVHKSIAITFPLAINNEPVIVVPDEKATRHPESHDIP